MDQELVAYLDAQFSESSRQIQGLREETAQQFQEMGQQIQGLREETVQRFEKVEEAIRHTQISVEGSRGDIQLLAEGIMGLTERLESFQTKAAKEFKNTHDRIRWPYSELDRRIRRLEDVEELRRRDPLDIIRERFGKPRS